MYSSRTRYNAINRILTSKTTKGLLTESEIRRELRTESLIQVHRYKINLEFLEKNQIKFNQKCSQKI